MISLLGIGRAMPTPKWLEVPPDRIYVRVWLEDGKRLFVNQEYVDTALRGDKLLQAQLDAGTKVELTHCTIQRRDAEDGVDDPPKTAGGG